MPDSNTPRRSKASTDAETYYDGSDADGFYASIWGGEDIHIGIYDHPEETIRDASRRTVATMAEQVKLSAADSVIDLGAGYGGSARYLAARYGCRVTCLNVSEVQNSRNRKLTAEQNLTGQITVVYGDFENLPYSDESFSVVWSQDALLHSGNRAAVMTEAARVCKSGGTIVFTDPMQADDANDGALEPVLERINLTSLGSPAFYRTAATENGLTLRSFTDLTPHLTRHYSRVLEELCRNESDARRISGDAYVDRMQAGLRHWVNAGSSGSLVWGIFVLDKT
ncbi:MAG: methyltransferase domain-containing protein [Spirochaetaceae bacterium]|nr:MAG: methyltransferase domain-containing protein [Spirochaetaceae bacterium]